MDDLISNFGDKISNGRNEHTFTSYNQPKNKGRKKTSEITKLLREIGRQQAPAELLNDQVTKDILAKLEFKGTINEVMIAKLYARALYHGDVKCIKLIFDTLNNAYGGGKRGKTIIQFVSPNSELTGDENRPALKSDAWG